MDFFANKRHLTAIFTIISLWLQWGIAGPICVRVNSATAKKVQRQPASKNKAKYKKRVPQGGARSAVKSEEVKLVKYTPLYWGGEKENGWLKVEGMTGNALLIQKKDVSFRMKCVSVQVNKSRLRKGPGSQFERAPVASKGDSFLYLSADDGWIEVMNSKGEKAWLNIDHGWVPSSRMRMKFAPESMSQEP